MVKSGSTKSQRRQTVHCETSSVIVFTSVSFQMSFIDVLVVYLTVDLVHSFKNVFKTT